MFAYLLIPVSCSIASLRTAHITCTAILPLTRKESSSFMKRYWLACFAPEFVKVGHEFHVRVTSRVQTSQKGEWKPADIEAVIRFAGDLKSFIWDAKTYYSADAKPPEAPAAESKKEEMKEQKKESKGTGSKGKESKKDKKP